MNEKELISRTKSFSLRIIRLVEALPATRTADVLGKQLLRAGTSVGANYRAACMGKSKADFAAKLNIAAEEADECIFWMELIVDAELMPETRLQELLQEAHELTAIFVSSLKTVRSPSRKE